MKSFNKCFWISISTYHILVIEMLFRHKTAANELPSPRTALNHHKQGKVKLMENVFINSIPHGNH